MNRLLYCKSGTAIYISHLDLMRTFQRAFLRAGLMVRHTEGFNPHAFISIALPLSVGCSSVCELLDFELIGGDLLSVPEKLNTVLPDGIKALSAYEASRKIKELSFLKCRAELIYDSALPDINEIESLFEKPEIIINKKSKSGVKPIDLRPHIKNVVITETGAKQIDVEAVVTVREPSLGPGDLLSAVETQENLKTDFARLSRIEIFDENMQVFR